mgnify:CR=1 FL=1
MKKSVTATVLACALVVGGVGLTPAGAAESSADVCYSVSIDKSSIVAADTRTEMIGFKELSTQAVDPAVLSESKGGSMTRATSRIEWDILREDYEGRYRVLPGGGRGGYDKLHVLPQDSRP